MRPVFRIAGLFGLFVMVAAVAGYFTLRLIVKSEDVVIVPDLVGKDVVYALKLLTDLGLNTKVSGYEYRPDIAKDHVAFQEPHAGAEIKKDRDVRIVVSKGPQTVVMPNLLNTDIREAKIIMDENGLAQGVMSETFAKQTRRGEVIGQVPDPGQVVNRGARVDLLTSLGPRPVRFKMPRLNGMAPEDAIVIVERSQLNLGRIHYVQKSDAAMNIVIGQNPRSGYPVASGTLVELTVNRKKGQIIRDQGLFFLYYPMAYGFLKRHIRLRINAFGALYDLFDSFWPPGKDVWILLPQQGEGAFFLYEDNALLVNSAVGSRSGYWTMGQVDTRDLRKRLRGEK